MVGSACRAVVCYDDGVQVDNVVGLFLVAGLAIFLIGAAAWRRDYEKPLSEALRVIHEDRKRRAWIHLWMIPAMFVTSAGVFGIAATVDNARVAVAVAVMAGVVYLMGAVCWVGA